MRDQLELVSRQQPGAKGGGAAGSANPPGANAGDPQEQAAYDGAIDLFRKGQYKGSLGILRRLHRALSGQPARSERPVLPGQQPLRAEGLQGCDRAAHQHGQKAPDNARAPDALLVIAGSQIELNNRAGARRRCSASSATIPARPPPARPSPTAAVMAAAASAVTAYRHPAPPGGLIALLLAAISHCWLTSRRGRPPCPGAGVARAEPPAAADPSTRVIVWDIRLPQALMAALVGAALGLAGAGCRPSSTTRWPARSRWACLRRPPSAPRWPSCSTSACPACPRAG